MTPETRLKNAVLRYLKTIPGMWIYKTSDRFRSGVPDILACKNGKFIAIELKRPGLNANGSRSEALQRHTIMKIEKAGGIGAVCYSLEDVKAVLQRAS